MSRRAGRGRVYFFQRPSNCRRPLGRNKNQWTERRATGGCISFSALDLWAPWGSNKNQWAEGRTARRGSCYAKGRNGKVPQTPGSLPGLQPSPWAICIVPFPDVSWTFKTSKKRRKNIKKRSEGKTDCEERSGEGLDRRSPNNPGVPTPFGGPPDTIPFTIRIALSAVASGCISFRDPDFQPPGGRRTM